MTSQKQLVSVKTGEPYQLARIYYQVSKKKTVLSALKKLKCIEYEAYSDRWNWLYEHEAKKLRFANSYHALLPSDKPLILGYFTFRGEDQMLLDLRSFDRAAYAIDFFDKRISRYAATSTHMRILNRCFSLDEMPNGEIHPSLDPFLEREGAVCLALDMEQAFEKIAAEYGDDEAGRQQAMQEYMEKSDDRHPELEELIIYPDKEDRITFPMMLRMRQVEAFEHWRGNFTFRSSNLIRDWVASMGDEFDDAFDDEWFEELPAEAIPEAEAEIPTAIPDQEAESVEPVDPAVTSESKAEAEDMAVTPLTHAAHEAEGVQSADQTVDQTVDQAVDQTVELAPEPTAPPVKSSKSKKKTK